MMRNGRLIAKYVQAILFVLLSYVAAYAQEDDYDWPYYDETEADFKDIVSDTTLFYRPAGNDVSVFKTLSRYGFSFTSYRARGMDDRYSGFSLSGLDISAGLSEYPDYTLYTFLSALAPEDEDTYVTGTPGGAIRLFDTRASSASPGTYVTYTYSRKRYRTGAKARSSGYIGSGWYYHVAARGRWGNDAHIGGVFSDEEAFSAALEKIFDGGVSLSGFAAIYNYARGLRGWSEKEVFELTGDNMYNPYWGVQQGRRRNSRVRRDAGPVFVMRCDIPSDAAYYSVAAGYRTSERSRSSLAWFDAPNPAPDYYMNLPGHRSEPHVADALEDAWRSGDPAFTQVDWGRLYESNLFAGGLRSFYLLADHVEKLHDFQAAFMARSRAEDGFVYDYGIRFRMERSRMFRRAADMLGGRYILNRDPYTGTECDMNEPGRIVIVGDTFDYDYAMARYDVSAYGRVEYRCGRWSAGIDGSVGGVWVDRYGMYDRERCFGGDSFGRSGTVALPRYDVSLYGRYGFSASHYLSLNAFSGAWPPYYGDFFYSPYYSNAHAAAEAVRMSGVELDYTVRPFGFLKLELSAYLVHSSDDTEILQYYDDLYDVYSIASITGIGKRNWGVEAGVKCDIGDRVDILAAVGIGSYVYSGDASADIYEEATGNPLVTNECVYLDGFVHTQSPQTSVAVSVRYSSPGGFDAEAEWLFADRRYVSLNPLRRTERIAGAMSSPEMRAECIRQERLPAASVLNIGVSKGFDLWGMRVFVNLSVNNLLGRRDIVYGGYEQTRLAEAGSDGASGYSPFPSRYSYYYPRTVLLSVTLGF